MPLQDFTFDNTAPEKIGVASQTPSNDAPDKIGVAATVPSNTPPDQIGVASTVPYNGPAWAIDDLVGQMLAQYDANGVLLDSIVIVSNTAINGSEELDITLGEDFASFDGQAVSGEYFVIQDAITFEWFILHDVDLGTAGSPFTGTFKRIGPFTTSSDLGFAMTNSPPA